MNVDLEVKEGALEEAEATLLAGNKVFDYKKLGRIFIRFPTIKETAQLNRYYSNKITELLRETTLMTYKKMKDVLEERGDWTSLDDEKIETYREAYISKTVTLEELKLKQRKRQEDKEFIEQLEKEQEEYYKKFIELSLLKNSLFENTIEKKAEEELLKYKIIMCTFREDNSPVWKSIDEFSEVLYDDEVETFMTDCFSFWRGLTLPLSENLPVQENGNKSIE